jgi:NYN domain
VVRVADSPFDRVLHEVRVYRGLPSPTRQPKGYAAARAQISVWQQLPKVKVVTRPLQYPDNWPTEKANEKGVDLQLALDMALMAHKRAYEVGILMSLDTDLKPILESVADLTRPGENPGPKWPHTAPPGSAAAGFPCRASGSTAIGSTRPSTSRCVMTPTTPNRGFAPARRGMSLATVGLGAPVGG